MANEEEEIVPYEPPTVRRKAKYIEINGESNTVNGWARKLGTSTHTIAARWKQVLAGNMTEEEFLAPVDPVQIVKNNKKNAMERTNKVRVKTLESLFTAIEKHVLPKLDAEVKAYMQGEAEGQGLKMVYKYRTLLPMQKLDEILDAHKGVKANFAFLMGPGTQVLPGGPSVKDIEIIK